MVERRDTTIQTQQQGRQAELAQRALKISSLYTAKELGLTGFEDDTTRQLIAAEHFLKEARHPSLKKILPVLLALKGKPYTLDNHFPFEPFFRTRMPRIVLVKSGRQIAKSTSLAAQGIVFSNSVPYFSTLYVTPLYEQIRRFSHNYMRQFLETSPVKRLFTGSKTTNQILQRSFKNGSSMYFSFAFIDAERVRGVPADKVAIDESVSMFSYVNVWVNQRVERRMIVDLVPGDVVLSVDRNGAVVLDVVKHKSYHGYRRCWTLRTADGNTLTATAEHRLFTNKGWLRVSDIIKTLVQRHASEDSREPADGVYASTGAATSGDAPGRRVDGPAESMRVLRQHPRRQAARVQLPQSPNLIGIRTHVSRDQEEQGLRQIAQSIQHPELSALRLYRCALLPSQTQASNASVAGSPDLGGDCLLVPGRRVDTGNRIRDHRDLRILESRGETTGQVAVSPRRALPTSEDHRQTPRKSVLGDLRDVRRYAKTDCGDQPLRTGVYAAQDQTLTETDRTSLPFLPADVFAGWPWQEPQAGYDAAAVLRATGLPEVEAPRGGVRLEGEVPRSVQGVEAALVSEKASLQETAIVAVEYAGWHDVYDIETVERHNFFAEGLLGTNCQDMNWDLLPVIWECLSGSTWGLKQLCGTPKSLDNTMEKLWVDSSQAEWVTWCHHGGCGYWNVPALTHDLVKMIGPWHRNISATCPGIVCAKCQKPLDPRRFGRWLHAYPERRWKFAGYHIPQIIMPMHYESQEKWDVLLGKMEGHAGTAINVFFNEVCGESYDLGAKLVTQTDLKNAAILPWTNTVDEAEKHLQSYLYRILAVDWGGGGGRLSNSNTKKSNDQRERTSFTALAVLGMRPDGKVDVLWGYRSLRTHDHVYEAQLILAAMRRFHCSHFAHDYNGAGSVRETLVIQAGVPVNNIIAIAYHPSARKSFMLYHPATDDHPRDWYSVDKSRSLQTTCEMIKCGYLRFFAYDYQNADSPGLLHDFLALLEEKIDTRLGSPVYCIVRNPNLSDDFAQAVNIGVASLCYMSSKWPDLAGMRDITITEDMMRYLSPSQMPDWNDLF